MPEALIIVLAIVALVAIFLVASLKTSDPNRDYAPADPSSLARLTEVWVCGYCGQMNETRPKIGSSLLCQNCQELRLDTDEVREVPWEQFHQQAQYGVRAYDDFIKWFLVHYPAYQKGDILAGRVGAFLINEAEVKFKMEVLSAGRPARTSLFDSYEQADSDDSDNKDAEET